MHCERHRNVGWLKSRTESHHLSAQILEHICLFQNERESRWDVMKGLVGSPSIYSHPGYNAHTHTQNPPILKTAHNHTFRAPVKFTTNLCESINTRAESDYFPGCRVGIKHQLPVQERTGFSRPATA